MFEVGKKYVWAAYPDMEPFEILFIGNNKVFYRHKNGDERIASMHEASQARNIDLFIKNDS